MRIDSNSNFAATEANLQKSGSARSASSLSAAASDPAEFSSKQAKESSLAATVLASPDVRQEKVQALRTQVQSGTYHVASAQIAASLLEQAHSMGK